MTTTTLDLDAIAGRYDVAQACKCIGHCHHVDTSYADVPALVAECRALAARLAEAETHIQEVIAHAVNLLSGGCDQHGKSMTLAEFHEAGGGDCPICNKARAERAEAALAEAEAHISQLRQWLRGELTLTDTDIDEALDVSRATPPQEGA